MVCGRDGAFARALDPAGHPVAVEAPPTSPEMPPQGLEKPGNGTAPEAPSPRGPAPACCGPTAENRSGVSPVTLRMRRNGVGWEPEYAS